MSIEERDYSINHPKKLSEWDSANQLIGANDKSENYFITISFDYDTVKYHSGIQNSNDNDNIPLLYIGDGTRSYREMKKQLIKFLANNNISCGIPDKEDFWDLICKVH